MAAPGTEAVLGDELRRLGIARMQTTPGGVLFKGSVDDIWRANLWSRVASRVVVRVAEFHASSFHELERRAKRVEWSRFVAAGQRVRFRVTCRKSRLYHSDAVAERLALAARVERVEAAENAENAENAEDAENAEKAGSADDAQLFIVRLVDDICTISADSSGALLHRRGYRQSVAKAPLRETLGAAMLLASGWESPEPLVDPMCGSGTIGIEAAMMARRIAPGIARSFAFERWMDHDPAKWTALVAQARDSALPAAEGRIIASDRDAGAVAAATANAERAGVEKDVEISQRAVSDADYPQPPGWIITNPPYGLRVGESAPLRNLYAQLGKILKGPARGYRLAMLSADRKLEAQVGVQLRDILRTNNGGIPVRLVIDSKDTADSELRTELRTAD